MCLINSSLRSQESRFKKQESKNQRTQEEPRSSARGFGGRKGGIRQAASGCYIRKKARDVDAVAVHASLVCCNETASRRASGQLLVGLLPVDV